MNSLIDFEGIDSETPNEDIIERVLKDISDSGSGAGAGAENLPKIVSYYFPKICRKIFNSNYIDMTVNDYQITLFSLMINKNNSERSSLNLLFHNYNYLLYKLSKREFLLLRSYILHVYNCGIENEYIHGFYFYDENEWKGLLGNGAGGYRGVTSKKYSTNEKTICDINKCIQNINSYKVIIDNLEVEVSNFAHLSMPVFSDGLVGGVDWGGVGVVSSLSLYLENLKNYIHELDNIYCSYSYLKNNLFFLNLN